MHINVPEYKTSFIIPHKSGNTIIYSTLVEVFTLNSIKYLPLLNNKDIEKTCILFVRNPVDRFFSSYDWYVKMKNLSNNGLKNLPQSQVSEIKESLKIFEDCEIDSLSKFIEKYKLFINNSNDTHYLPQSSFFLTKSVDKGMRANLNFNFRKEYDVRFENHNYKFFRIEDINNMITINKNFLITNGFNFNLLKMENLAKHNLKTLSFFNDFPKEFNYLFMVFYTYFKDFYSENHHSKNPNYYYGEITLDEYLMVHEMFKKESEFFGYDSEPNIIDKKFKSTII